MTFTDMSLSETGFTVERATDAAFTTRRQKPHRSNANPGWNNTVTYLDSECRQRYGQQLFLPRAVVQAGRGLLEPAHRNDWYPDPAS